MGSIAIEEHSVNTAPVNVLDALTLSQGLPMLLRTAQPPRNLPAWRGGADHSLDIPFLFRHPQVVGPGAPADFRTTSDHFSAAAIQLVNDLEPWEDIGVAERWMRFHADNSGTRNGNEGFAARRWRRLADPPERYQKFMLGMVLLDDAMGYASRAFSPDDFVRQ